MKEDRFTLHKHLPQFQSSTQREASSQPFRAQLKREVHTWSPRDYAGWLSVCLIVLVHAMIF